MANLDWLRKWVCFNLNHLTATYVSADLEAWHKIKYEFSLNLLVATNYALADCGKTHI